VIERKRCEIERERVRNHKKQQNKGR
jgi:hypothetical protein